VLTSLFFAEFANALPSDLCRLEQLLCQTAQKGHPMQKFMWGMAVNLNSVCLFFKIAFGAFRKHPVSED
jgi:secreted Zn-dependent insulinase-like peptidase